jgi:hypothetical protein
MEYECTEQNGFPAGASLQRPDPMESVRLLSHQRSFQAIRTLLWQIPAHWEQDRNLPSALKSYSPGRSPGTKVPRE